MKPYFEKFCAADTHVKIIVILFWIGWIIVACFLTWFHLTVDNVFWQGLMTLASIGAFFWSKRI